jgi:hypothetical protein
MFKKTLYWAYTKEKDKKLRLGVRIMSEQKHTLEGLRELSIFELRIVARHLGVTYPSKLKKAALIDKVLDVQSGRIAAVPHSKLGRPVKRTALQEFIEINKSSQELSYPTAAEALASSFEEPSGHDFDRAPSDKRREKLVLSESPPTSKDIGSIVDTIAPIEYGGRVLVFGQAETGKSTVLRSLCASVAKLSKKPKIVFLTIDETEENIDELKEAGDIELVTTSFTDGSIETLKKVDGALRLSKDLALEGDVIFFIDSLDRLAKEYANLDRDYFQKESAFGSKLLEMGITPYSLRTLNLLKRFFVSAKRTENGSLTIIAATSPNFAGENERMDAELKRFATTLLCLDDGLAQKRIYPAIDLKNTFTRKDSDLLDNESYERLKEYRRRFFDGEVKTVTELF